MSPLQTHILALSKQGWKIPKIVERFGYAHSFVVSCVRAPKPAQRKVQKPRIDSARAYAIRAAILADPTRKNPDLAREFGVSRPRITQLRGEIRRNLEKTQ